MTALDSDAIEVDPVQRLKTGAPGSKEVVEAHAMNEEASVPTCFVIQPFDSDKFDKRFDEIYKPALRQAGLDAYRVDRDPSVQVPIETIEDRIRTATICLADITEDNPNVWYELGFSFAIGHDVILVCSDERKSKYPFDIQHRKVTRYGSGSRSDFDELHQNIAERAEALLNNTIGRADNTATVVLPSTLGYSGETVLKVAAERMSVPGERFPAYSLKDDVERSGLVGAGYAAAVSRLKQIGFLNVFLDDEWDGYPCHTVTLTDSAWKWIAENEDSLADDSASGRASDAKDDFPF